MESKLVFGLGLFLIVVSLVAGCKWVARERTALRETGKVRMERGEADFVRAAIHSNVAEIKFAELALAKSADPALRKIATMLRADHTESLERLLQIAENKNISLPDLGKISIEDRASHLPRTGLAFDKGWCAEMIGKHEMNFQLLELVWEKTEDEDVREIVNAAIPHLINHLESLVDYQEQFGRRHDEVVAIAGVTEN
jgi:putative membrane protein